MYRAPLILQCLVISLSVAALAPPAAAQDEGYPPDTLTPTVDLGLQPGPLWVPAIYRGVVPAGLTVNLPPGFSATVFAAGLSKPRLMAFSPDGVLHVCNMGADQILALPDRNRNDIADAHIVVLDSLREAHSLAFYKGDLYVAEEHQVIRAIDADGDGIYEDREVVLGDIPWEGQHDTRTLVFDEENGKGYVSVGAPCDLCRMDLGKQFNGSSNDLVPQHPARGTILQFDDDGANRRVFVTGVRNVIGMDLHPITNELWGTNNGHDWEGRTIPPEWIDVLREGDFQGYPLVHSHQVWNDFSLPQYQRVLPITAADTLRVLTQKQPAVLVPAHWAPMAIHFYTGSAFPSRYQNAAFVAFRAGQAKLSSHPGYKVQVLFGEPDGSDMVRADFLTGFQTGTTQEAVWGFPVGVATDADGSLYVSSDARTNAILKITHSQLQGSWAPELPDVVGLSELIDVRASVQVQPLAGAVGPPRVTADLSALGGSSAVPLVDAGGGRFLLDERIISGAVGTFDIRVRVTQSFTTTTGVTRTALLEFVRTVDVEAPAWRHDLPTRLVGDSGLDMSATVHIDPLSPMGDEPRVFADLSALGGPSNLPLVAAGGGSYTFAVRFEVVSNPGRYDIRVHLAQRIDGQDFAHDFIHEVVVAPADVPVLDEVLAADWRLSGTGGATIEGFSDLIPSYSGAGAMAIDLQPPGTLANWVVELAPGAPVLRPGFEGLRLTLHVGASTAPRVPVLYLEVDGLTLDLVRDPQPGLAVDLDSDSWQVLDIPFTAFDQRNVRGNAVLDTIAIIDRIRLVGNLRGRLYLDDVRVASTIPASPPRQTAVTERHDDSRPADFRLEPAYPNPFNSATVVRYALSEPADVRLIVYNAAGQRVARLAEGARPQGRHTVTWHGRADHGHRLASGVYLIHLEAESWLGRRTATRRVLLLR